jgi:hypothetical protein
LQSGVHRVGRTRLQISRNSGSSPDKCPFVCGSARAPLLGRMSNDMPILLTCHHSTLADRFALLWCTLPSVTAAVIHVVPWCTGSCPRSIVDISRPREGSLPCKNACRPTRQPCRAEMRRAMQRTDSGGSKELGNRWSLCGCQENAHVPIGHVHTGASSLRTTAQTDNTREAFAADCRKFPALTKDCLCFALRCSHRPCGGPLETVNLGICGISGRSNQVFPRMSSAAAFWACLHYLYSKPCASRD